MSEHPDVQEIQGLEIAELISKQWHLTLFVRWDCKVTSDKVPELEEAMQNNAKTHYHCKSIKNKQQKTASDRSFISLTQRE